MINVEDLDMFIKANLLELKNDEGNCIRYLNEITEDSLIEYLKQYYKYIKELYNKDLEGELKDGVKCNDVLELKTLNGTMKGLLSNLNQVMNYIYDSVYESGIVHDILIDNISNEDKRKLFYLKGSEDILFWAIYTQYEVSKLEDLGDEDALNNYKMSDKYNVLLSLDLIIDSEIEKFINKKVEKIKKEILPRVCKTKGIDIRELNSEYLDSLNKIVNDNIDSGLENCVTIDELIVYLSNK